MDIFQYDEVPAEEVEGVPGVKIRWVIDDNRGAPNYSMRVFEVEPGASTPMHDHWNEQEMYILAGRGEARTPEGEATEVTPGTVIWVPPYDPHQFVNTGDETLRFICVIPNEPEQRID
jgi:quercetin dioxygenase-like cupin family protein